mmetsp:Transcript_20543/g.65440  ORF Transcript_20543/g.65440 Transcript_20543/m.65440 type:complete len:492 (+) Transcript_20543:2159-3634(+)
MDHREAAVLPLLTGSLRLLPLLTQVATCEALTYCILEQPSGASPAPRLVPLDAPLLSLLDQALALAEAPDDGPRDPREQAAAAPGSGPLGIGSEPASLRGRMLGRHVRGVPLPVRQRVVAIELLAAALSYDALKGQPYLALRHRMIGCFFKSLTVRHEEVVTVARDALAAVISQSKLQKELLQSSLRPILLNLADYRKLSVPLLQGLSRLLSLLSNFFNLTLGEKLLEHLRRWTDPEALAKAKTFRPGDDVNIPCAILSLFHLLPPAPNKFLAELVAVCLSLEAVLPGSTALGRHWSPHREALVPYLNRHAKETVSHLLDRMTLPADAATKEKREDVAKAFRFLLSLVRYKHAAEVRDELARQWQPLLQRTLEAARSTTERQVAAQLRYHGVALVHGLCKLKPEWLPSCPDVLQALVHIWNPQERLAAEEQAAEQAVAALAARRRGCGASFRRPAIPAVEAVLAAAAVPATAAPPGPAQPPRDRRKTRPSC